MRLSAQELARTLHESTTRYFRELEINKGLCNALGDLVARHRHEVVEKLEKKVSQIAKVMRKKHELPSEKQLAEIHRQRNIAADVEAELMKEILERLRRTDGDMAEGDADAIFRESVRVATEHVRMRRNGGD